MELETEPKLTSDMEDTECWIAGGVGLVGRSGMSSNSGHWSAQPEEQAYERYIQGWDVTYWELQAFARKCVIFAVLVPVPAQLVGERGV